MSRTVRTKENEELILANLRRGMSRRGAGAIAMSLAAFNAWLASDDEFRDKVEAAEAEAERHCVNVLWENMDKTAHEQTGFRPAQWWLERRRSEDFKERSDQTINGVMQMGLAELSRVATKDDAPTQEKRE